MATSIISLAASITLFGIAVSSPKAYRAVPHIISLILTAISFVSSHEFPDPVNSIWALMMAVWTTHSASVLWLEPPHILHSCRTGGQQPAWRLWNNPRLIDTPGQTLRAHSLPRSYSLSTFTLRQLSKVIVYVVAYKYLVPLTFTSSCIPAQLEDFDAIHTTYFRRLVPGHPHPVTLHDTKIRCVWAVLWAIGPYLTLEAAHAIFSILFVLVLRVDRPSDWPPLFGPLSEAYNLRRFWSHFWHRILMRPYSNFGKLVSRKILGLSARSQHDNVCVAFSVFVLSGVAHAAAAWQLGDELWFLDIAWFILCFAAGATESIVSKSLCRCFLRSSKPVWLSSRRTAVLLRVAGFCWVFVFFFWSVPKWQYPKLHRAITAELHRDARSS